MNAYSPDVIERLGWVLIHSLWQFAVIAIFAAIIVAVMRRRSATMQYGMLVVAMVMMIVAPFTTWMMLPQPAASKISDLKSPIDDKSMIADMRLANLPVLADEERLQPSVSPMASASGYESGASLYREADAVPLADASAKSMTEYLRSWFSWIVGGWLIGVLLCSLRPLLGWRMLRRLRRIGISPPSEEVLAAFAHVSQRLGLRRAVQVFHSTLATGPLVVGYLKPVVLLPMSLVTSIPMSQLEAILAHELAHVCRHDFIINLAQTLIETLFFYHPAVWWLSHRIRTEREHCCDDLVVKLFGNGIEYGRALLAIEQFQGQQTVLALGAADGSLLNRIRRIVELRSKNRSEGIERGSAVFLSLVTLCLLVILSTAWTSASQDANDRVDVKNSNAASEESTAESSSGETPRFTDELHLKLNREQAHRGQWFFVDLDLGTAVIPPFDVDIDTTRLPYFVNLPAEADLNAWLVEKGVDLILYSKTRPQTGSGKRQLDLQIRSVRTFVAHVASGLKPQPNNRWTWKTQPQEVVDLFARKDEAVHVSGFVPNASNGSLSPANPHLNPFRTAENRLGLFLLEQPDGLKDEMTFRIVHVANSKSPLADVEFGQGELVSGKDGPKDPAGKDVDAVPVTKETKENIDKNGREVLTLRLHESCKVEWGFRIRRVEDFSSKIISVKAILSPMQLPVRGESIGSTTLKLTDERGEEFMIPVKVVDDDEANLPPADRVFHLTLANLLPKHLSEDQSKLTLLVGGSIALEFPWMVYYTQESEKGIVTTNIPKYGHPVIVRGVAAGRTRLRILNARKEERLIDVEVLSVTRANILAVFGKSEKIAATLPDGIVVELLGVSTPPIELPPIELPSKDKRDWWKGDGTTMDAAPIPMGSVHVGAEQSDGREFVFRISEMAGEAPTHVTLKQRFKDGQPYEPDGNGWSIGSTQSGHLNGDPKASWQATSEHVAGPVGDADSATLEIRIGSGTNAEMLFDAKGKRTNGDSKDDVWQLAAVQKMAERVEVLRTGPHESGFAFWTKPFSSSTDEGTLDVALIDVTGKRHSRFSSGSDGNEEYHAFRIKPEDIDTFVVRLRPFQYLATFENVSLKPGKQSDVKVLISSLPAEIASDANIQKPADEKPVVEADATGAAEVSHFAGIVKDATWQPLAGAKIYIARQNSFDSVNSGDVVRFTTLDGKPVENLILKPGEVRDLGDVRVVPNDDM